MQWTFDQTITFVTHNYDALVDCARQPSNLLVLCPSYPALYTLYEMFTTTGVAIGAQDCSDHSQGAFTGQVSAAHLKSVGCSYCIIGHSERRMYNHETNNIIAEKCWLLLATGITPILCLGETEEEKNNGTTLAVLEKQLKPVLHMLAFHKAELDQSRILIAYEPVWAIGSNQVPTQEHLDTVYAWLEQAAAKAPFITWHFLYGGSVSESSIGTIKGVGRISGFLIGGASQDFQEFEKIVKYDK